MKLRISGPHCNENSSHFTEVKFYIWSYFSRCFRGKSMERKIPFADHHLPPPSPTPLSDLRTRESQRVSSTRRINVLEKLDVRSSKLNLRQNII